MTRRAATPVVVSAAGRRASAVTACVAAALLGCGDADGASSNGSSSDAGLAGAAAVAPVMCPVAYPGLSEAESRPSFTDQVLPALRKCSDRCHQGDDSMTTELWLGPRFQTTGPVTVDALTPEELDAVHAGLLSPATSNPLVFRVKPGHPELSQLMVVVDGCQNDQNYMGYTHLNEAQPTRRILQGRDLHDLVRDWILNGAPNDSERVAPPSLEPMLHAPLRVHSSHSHLGVDERLALFERIRTIGLQSGVCLEIELVPGETRVAPDGLEAWLESSCDPGLLVSGDGSLLSLHFSEACDPMPDYVAGTVVPEVARTLRFEPDPSQRAIVTARAWYADLAKAGDDTCPPPRVTEVLECSGQACTAYDTGLQGLALPPCCTASFTCGVEPADLAGVYPQSSSPLSFLPDCITVSELLAPGSDTIACTGCDTACPTVSAAGLPFLGDRELPGCCLPTGRCGVSSLGLPTFVGFPTCLDQAGLAGYLGSTSPNPPITVDPVACTPRPAP